LEDFDDDVCSDSIYGIVVILEAGWSPQVFCDFIDMHGSPLSGTDLLFSRRMLWRKEGFRWHSMTIEKTFIQKSSEDTITDATHHLPLFA
jgi:hypothetical protein